MKSIASLRNALCRCLDIGGAIVVGAYSTMLFGCRAPADKALRRWSPSCLVHPGAVPVYMAYGVKAKNDFPTQCSFGESCRQYLVIEHDGSVYPCDFHVMPSLRLGNIRENSFEELLASPVYAKFAAVKTACLPQKCRLCAYWEFCHGDCPRNRQSLCVGWRRFFAHALPRLRELADDFR